MEPRTRFVVEPDPGPKASEVLVPCKCGNAVEFGVIGSDREVHECLVCGASVSLDRPPVVDRAAICRPI